jgi:MYXO-CTERM domain-containing protein
MPVAILNDDAITDEWIDTVVTFVGYGITSSGGFDSGIKRTTDNALVRYTSNLLYAFDETSGTCQGDSGGPSFQATDEGYLEQVGITSFGGQRCEEGEHGHTRVDVFIPWILDIAPDTLTEPPPDDVGPGGSGTGGPGFLNWGVTNPVNGVGGRFSKFEGGDGGGCSTAPGGPMALGWLMLAALGMRRR